MNESTRRRVIYLLRHGMPVGGNRYRGSTDDAVSHDGFAEMCTAVSRCDRVDRIVSSPLRRCAGFARALAAHRRLPLRFEEGFREIHFGEWEGHTPADLMARCPGALRRFWRDPGAFPPPGGEPMEQFRARVLAAWRAIALDTDFNRMLLVIHGGTVRVIVGHVRKLAPRDLIGLDVPHASVHRIALDDDGGPVEVKSLC